MITRAEILNLARDAGCQERKATVHPGKNNKFAPHDEIVFIFNANELEAFAKGIVLLAQSQSFH